MAKEFKKSGKEKAANLPVRNKYPLFLIYLLSVLFLIVVLYGKTIHYGLSYFDDDAIIFANTTTLSHGISLPTAFLSDAEFGKKIELYRPLQNLSFMFDYKLFGANFGLYRITNMLFHFLNCVLLFLVFNFFIKNKYLSAMAGILFAIHPMFALDVAWLPARGDVFLAFFGLLSIWSFFRFLKSKHKGFFAIHIAAVFLSLLSKESAISIPVICIVLCYFYERSECTFKKVILYSLFLLPGILLFFVLRKFAIHEVPTGSYGIIALLFNLRFIPEFFLKFFIPYSIPSIPFYETSRTLAGGVVLIVFFGVLYFLKSNAKIVITGLVWFLLLSLPAMLYRPDWSGNVYDYCFHRSYFPSIGIILILFAGLENLRLNKRFFIPVYIYLLLIFVISFNYISVFGNTLTFYTDSAKTNPQSVFVMNNLGNAYFMNNNFGMAKKQYEKAIAINPGFSDAHYNLAMVLAREKNFKDALTEIDVSLKTNPDNIKFLKTRTKILFDLKDYKQAASAYSVLIEKGINSEETEFGYALCLLNMGDDKNAIDAMKSVINKYPDNTDAPMLLVRAYQNLSMLPEALQEYKKMPGFTTKDNLLSNAGYLLLDMDSIRQAHQFFESSLKINPQNIDALLGMALCNYVEGNYSGARDRLNNAAAIDVRIKEGISGLEKMMSEGYYFSPRQTEMFKQMFSRLKF